MKKDIIIIGAGPAGLSLACSLAETNLEITVVENQPIKNIAKQTKSATLTSGNFFILAIYLIKAKRSDGKLFSVNDELIAHHA